MEECKILDRDIFLSDLDNLSTNYLLNKSMFFKNLKESKLFSIGITSSLITYSTYSYSIVTNEQLIDIIHSVKLEEVFHNNWDLGQVEKRENRDILIESLQVLREHFNSRDKIEIVNNSELSNRIYKASQYADYAFLKYGNGLTDIDDLFQRYEQFKPSQIVLNYNGKELPYINFDINNGLPIIEVKKYVYEHKQNIMLTAVDKFFIKIKRFLYIAKNKEPIKIPISSNDLTWSAIRCGITGFRYNSTIRKRILDYLEVK